MSALPAHMAGTSARQRDTRSAKQRVGAGTRRPGARDAVTPAPHRGSPGISGAWTTIRVEMHDAPLPDLILYVREGCHLCAEARISITLLLSERASTGRPTPRLVERDIESDPAWQRAYFATIPVIELGDRRVELVTSVAKMRRLLTDVLGA